MSVMHGLMPPHPGPVVAVAALHANMGLVLFWGFVIGIPTAAIAGPLYARFAVRFVEANPPPLVDKTRARPAAYRAPGLRADAVVDPAAGRADAAGDAGRAAAAEGQPPARGGAVRRPPGDGAADRGAVRVVVARHALPLHARAGAEVHRGVHLGDGDDAADRGRRRRLREGADRRGRRRGHQPRRRGDAHAAPALRLAAGRVHPRRDRIGDGRDHDRVGPAGAGAGPPPGIHAQPGRADHHGDGLRVAVPVAPERLRASGS